MSSRLSTFSSLYAVSVCCSQKDRKRITLRTSTPHWGSIAPPQGIDSRANDPARIDTTSDNYSALLCEVPVLCAKRVGVEDMHTVGYGCQKRCSGNLAKPARVVEVVSVQSILFLEFVSWSAKQDHTQKLVATIAYLADGHHSIQNLFDVALQQIDLICPAL